MGDLDVDGKRKDGPLRFVDEAQKYGLDICDGSVVSAFADYDRDGNLWSGSPRAARQSTWVARK